MRQLWHHWLQSVTTIAVLCILACLGRSEAADTAEAVRLEPVARTATTNGIQPSSAFDGAIDGLIVVVDCSETMSIPAIKNTTQWGLSIILDAAPDGIPTSLVLFGHNPSVPKNLVEIVGDQRLIPLSWRAKSHYRRAAHLAVQSPNRVYLSGALNVAQDIVLTSDLKRVAIVVFSDGQNPGDKLELAVDHCVQTPGICGVRVIGLGSPEEPPLQHLHQVFHGPKLSLGYSRTTAELTDSLRPIAAELDIYRRLQCDREHAVVSNLEATLAHSNMQLEQTSTELNHRTVALTAQKEANHGLQKSVHDLTSQVAVLDTKTADRARHNAETILKLENLAANEKKTIEKRNEELAGIRKLVADLEASDKSAKAAVAARTQDAQALQAALDKLRVDYQALDAVAKALRADLCCCIDGKRHLEHKLKLVEAELAGVNIQLAAKITKLASTEKELAATSATLSSTQATLAATSANLTAAQGELQTTKQTLATAQSDLASTKTALTDKNDKLIECHARVCCLEAALAAAQQAALGAAREMAAAKHDAPNAIFNSPLQSSEGTNGASGAAGGAAGGSGAGGSGAGGSGAGGSAAGGSAPGTPGGGNGSGSGSGGGDLLSGALGAVGLLALL